MFLKAHERCKDGKRHVYYSLTESLRVSRKRVVQRTVLHLGELNTTQVERWQRTIEAIHEDGQRRQLRLFTDREGQVPVVAEDVAEVILSSLVVRRPRRFGDCWIGCKLWEELGLRAFWDEVLGEQRGEVPWAKVVELLVVNRLCDPRSELFIHEKWFAQTAMDLLLDCSAAVAEKDRLYRALDRMVAHKDALERHLAGKWRDLFGASFDVLLYDLTSTYFEGDAEGVDKATRGYSRDHRPDCAQVVIAMVVTPEGFPRSYEVFEGNRADVTTLEAMLDQVEAKHGRARRIWVFDRGIVSEANLQRLRARDGQYVVGTPRHRLQDYEKELLAGSWQQINESVQVQLIAQEQETYVLARSVDRAKKEEANRIKELGGQFGIKRLCVDNFWGTEALHHLAIAAYNLCVLLQRRLGQLEKCELNTLRWRLFGRAAVWSRAGSKPTLKLAVRGVANRNWWREMLAKLTAFPNCHAVVSLQA